MEKIFILGNSDTVRQLGYDFIEIPNLINDYEIHTWLVSLFQNNQIDKLVIEIGNSPVLSLKIGLHIRLSIDELRDKALIPLLFVSASSLNSIIIESKFYCHILASKGAYFSTFDTIEKIKLELSAIEGISQNEYRTCFLDIIKVTDDEKTGRHSLANIWGAHSMDKAANTDALINNHDFQQNKAKLYFKYVSAFHKLNLFSVKIVGRLNLGKAKTINAANKKILLIDDEAEKGWETVLRKIFKTSSLEDFVVIKEKVKDYDSLSAGSKNRIENTPFDLYLIDLRLNGKEEENILKTGDFSGMKILQKIKNDNPGNQVIIFSASNKVWNLKALLDAGADGYYMKESPEFGFSTEFSEQNYSRFQEDVKSCFKRDFLKKLYGSYQTILQTIDSLTTYPNDFKAELKNQFQLFWDMILHAKTDIQFANSYVTLYLVIELINNFFIKKVDDAKWVIINTGKLLDWKWDEIQKKYTNTQTDVTGNNPPEWQKFAGLYFQKWQETDRQLVENIYHLIRLRNKFVHNTKEKDKQTGQYFYHDVYTRDGVEKLFGEVEKIIGFLSRV